MKQTNSIQRVAGCRFKRSLAGAGQVLVKQTKRLGTVALVLWLAIGATPALAWDRVGPGIIVSMENGWFGEGMAFTFSVAYSGNTCPAGPATFAVASSHGAYKEVVALLLGAYLAKTPVSLVVDQGSRCIFGDRYPILSVVVQ